MVDIPKISIDVERKGAVQSLNQIIIRLRKIRKELGSVDVAVKSLNKTLGDSGLKGKFRETRLEEEKGTKSRKKYNQSLANTSKVAQLAFGPLSGIAARIQTINSLTTSGTRIFAAFAAVFAGVSIVAFKAFKEFSKFDRVLADISKNVGLIGTPLRDFGKVLQDISKQSGLTAEQVGKIADSAGRLGILGRGLEKFTRIIAQLTLTTNLQGDEAATSLARLLTVTNESVDRVDVIGSVIAKLGANTAASETEIVNFAKEVASAGAQFDLSSVDVIALGTSFVALGRRAESTRTTILKTFTALDESLATQGTEAARTLEKLFDSPLETLQERFLVDPTQFFVDFIKELRNAQNEGQRFRNILEDIGITEIRVLTDLGASLKGVADIQKQLLLAREEARDPTELGVQVARRELAETTRLDQAIEGIRNAGIALGELFAPVVIVAAESIERLSKSVEFFTSGAQTGTERSIESLIDRLIKETGIILGPQRLQLGERSQPLAIRKINTILDSVLVDFSDSTKEITEVQRGRFAILKDLLEQQQEEKGLTDKQNELLISLSNALKKRKEAEDAAIRAAEEKKKAEEGAIRELKARERQEARLLEFATGDLSPQIGRVTGRIQTEFIALEGQQAALEAEFQKRRKELTELRKEANATGQIAITRAIAQLNTIEKEKIKTIVSATEKATVRSFENIFKQFQRGFADAIFEAFRSTEDRNILGNLADRFADIFARTFADVAAQNLTTGFIAPLFSAVGGAFAGQGQQGFINQAISSATGLSIDQIEASASGFQELADSLKSARDSIDEFGKATLGVSDLAGNLFGGFGIGFATTGNLLGGLGGSLGQVLGDQLAKPISTAVSDALGDAVGKAVGQIAGPIGGFIVSQLVSSLKDSPEARAFLGLRGGQATTLGTKASGAKAPVQEVLDLGNQFADLLNRFAEVLDTNLTDAINSLELFINTGKTRPFRIITGEGGQQKFETAEEAIVAAVQSAFGIGGFGQVPPAVKQIVQQFEGTDIQRLGEVISFASEFATGFGTLIDPLTDFQTEIKNLMDGFDAAGKTAKALSLSLEAVEKARDIELLKQRLGFEEQIRLGILDIVDPQTAALERLRVEQEERLKNAQTIGANIVAVEKLNALERQQVIEQFANQSRNVLQDFLTEITATTSSQLPTETVLANASRRFSEIREAFLEGDTSVSGELVDAARSLLDVRRQFSASGPQFFATQKFIESTLQAALDVQASQQDPQIEILQELAIDQKEGNSLLEQLKGLLESLVNVTTGGGSDIPPFTQPPGPNGTGGTTAGGAGNGAGFPGLQDSA